MTVKELIDRLKLFPGDWEVTITDGFQALCYKGSWEILPFSEDNGATTIDIGVGGTAFYE